MGKETIHSLMNLPNINIYALIFNTKKDIKIAKKFKRMYDNRFKYFIGDIRNYKDCQRLMQNSQYILHLAALISPASDHNEKQTISTNFIGTKNIVDAHKEYVSKTKKEQKFIYISTVALYGNRDFKHPWGRVGDPLLPSVFDIYGNSKLFAERYVLDADLDCFAILRQTGILYDNMLMNNIKDGLMFHTSWNVPIEWVTAKDSGQLMHNIIIEDLLDGCPNFWNKAYNIGGGQFSRQTGYETFDDGFKIIGGSTKTFFNSNWNIPRNFHCFWFSDSDDLEKQFHFRSQSTDDFWNMFAKRHKIYKIARIISSKIIKRLVITPLLKNNNAPQYWIDNNNEAKIQAYFNGMSNYKKIPTKWDNFVLECEKQDYNTRKSSACASFLNHGYDETKSNDNLNINDMQEDARFRGGKCLSITMKKGDMRTKLTWSCHAGHVFEASPYTILKAGHWCPHCVQMKKWNYDNLAKNNPFYAQIYYDTHNENENYIYEQNDGIATIKKGDLNG